MNNQRQKLNKVLGRTEVFALAFGTMVGWSWIMFATKWIDAAGVLGSIAAFTIAGTMCILVGLTYAELTSALPLAGGELVFSYRGLGYMGAWITGWTISFAYIGVAAWEGIALSTAFDYLHPLPKMFYLWTIAGNDVYLSWSVVGIIGAIILTALNLVGVKTAAIVQIMLVLVMLVVGIIFTLGSVAFGKTDYLMPLFTDMKGMGFVMLMAPSMFIGFDVVSKSAEEMNMPLKNIAKVLILSIVAVMAWYILMIWGTAMSAPPSLREQPNATVADTATFAFQSGIFGKMIIVGGICGIITSWNGFIMGASRILFAMGRAKMLPRIFGVVNPKFQTPAASIIFVGLICCISPLLGENALVWLIHVSSFATVLAYLLVSISFLSIRKKEPNLQKKYVVKHGKAVGFGAVVSALFFLFWYTPISPSSLSWPYEWGLVIVWTAIGFAMVSIIKIVGFKDSISAEEREQLMFGDEYSREKI